MHDPIAVAFEILSPIPRRSRPHDAKPSSPRWKARYEWATWRKPWEGWSRFWVIAGRGFYFPALVTVWHNEPGGRDFGEVCCKRVTGRDGKVRLTRSWRWHVWHWSIRVPPLQALRRRLLTRCAECGRKGSPDVSHSWGGPRGKWWQGEPGLYHRECSMLVSMRHTREDDEHLIRALFAAYRVAVDLGEPDALERFRHLSDAEGRYASGFRAHRRLETLLGWDRDSNYRLTPRGAASLNGEAPG